MFLNSDNEVLRFLGTDVWPTIKWVLVAIASGIATVASGVGVVFGYQRKEISTLYTKNEKLQNELALNSKELNELKTENEVFRVRLASLEEKTQRIAKTEKLTINLPQKEENNES